MATANPFDLLGDDDNDDPSQLIAKLPVAVAKKSPVGGVAAKPAAKLPSKPLPPAQAVREAKNDNQRGGGRFGGRGGRGGYNRESADNENFYGNNNGFSGGYRNSENGDGEKGTERRGPPRFGNRGGRRGGYSNGDGADGGRPRREFERRSGTGRGSDMKRGGAGSGNWGTAADEVAPVTEENVTETEKIVESEKQENGTDVNKENNVEGVEQKEPEVKVMTLEEYEKVLEEKRKALEALKSEERKVGLDKDLAKMQLLSNKKNNEEDIFVKLGSEKDKKKEAADKEEKAKKSVIAVEFLKSGGGRGRGRGGVRGGDGNGTKVNNAIGGGPRMKNVIAPSIEDVAQFPSLSVK